MRTLDSSGFSLLAPEPPLAPSRAVIEALACWRFLGGWRLEHLPAFAALYPLADPEMTVELLQTIRDLREQR